MQDAWISTDTPTVVSQFGFLAMVAVACAALAALILLWYLARRPALGRATRVVLLFGFGIFPIGAALNANVASYEHTKTRAFCGSCHVMTPYTHDSLDPGSTTLAARHARNSYFGSDNCYACHADYGMFGTVTTKLAGMGHAWRYYTGWRSLGTDEALARIEIAQPFGNHGCMQCHSTLTSLWTQVDEHAAMLDELRANRVSCASEGCHGPAHPFSKAMRRAAGEERAP